MPEESCYESVYSRIKGKDPAAEVAAFQAIKNGAVQSLAAIFSENADLDKGAIIRVQPPGFLIGGVVAFTMVNAVISCRNLNDEQRLGLLSVLHKNGADFSSSNQDGGLPMETARELKRSNAVCRAVEKFAMK